MDPPEQLHFPFWCRLEGGDCCYWPIPALGCQMISQYRGKHLIRPAKSLACFFPKFEFCVNFCAKLCITRWTYNKLVPAGTQNCDVSTKRIFLAGFQYYFTFSQPFFIVGVPSSEILHRLCAIQVLMLVTLAMDCMLLCQTVPGFHVSALAVQLCKCAVGTRAHRVFMLSY